MRGSGGRRAALRSDGTSCQIKPGNFFGGEEKKMNKFILRQSILLFLTAVIWGVAFVAQSAGMEYIGPFTYNGVRCILGGLVLIPCVILLAGMQAGREQDRETGKEGRRADAPLDGAQGEDVQSGAEPVAARQTQDVGHKGRLENAAYRRSVLWGSAICGK